MLARAQVVVAGVRGHAVEPGLELAHRFGSRIAQLVKGGDEDILGQVLRLLAVADDARAEVVDGGAVLAVEALEGVAVAGPEGRRQSCVRFAGAHRFTFGCCLCLSASASNGPARREADLSRSASRRSRCFLPAAAAGVRTAAPAAGIGAAVPVAAVAAAAGVASRSVAAGAAAVVLVAHGMALGVTLVMPRLMRDAYSRHSGPTPESTRVRREAR